MNNLEKVNAERDDFIRKTLQEDKIISEPVLNTLETHIDSSNLKVKKYTYTQKNIILILLLLLAISVAFNIYLSITHTTLPKFANTDFNNIDIPENQIKNTNIFETENQIIKNEIVENNIIENTVIENTIAENIVDNNISINTSAEINSTNTENTIKNVTIKPKNTTTYNNIVEDNTLNNSQEINLDELKKLLELYAIGINRIDYEENNLESNTFLLIIARKYFSSIPSKNIPASQKEDFVFNVKNTNTFLKELTGKEFNGSISSYSNYIGYASSSNSYQYGKDSDIVTQEKYTCSNLKITNTKQSIYTATARIVRKIDEEITNYDITIKFSLNENFKYQQFKILSLDAENKSFSPDNTLHLVD